MSQLSRYTALTGCTVLALGLAGCASGGSVTASAGGSVAASTGVTPSPAAPALADLSAEQISAKALAATKSAKSLTLTVDGKEDGAPMKFRMRLTVKGDCEGDLGMDGGKIGIIKVGRTAYLKFDQGYLKAQGSDGAAMAQMLRGRWLKTSTTDADFKDMVGMCDLRAFLKDAFRGDSGEEDATKGAMTTVGGVPAIPLIEKLGKETDTGYVAARGKPYLLKLVVAGGSDPATMTFTDYDKNVTIAAPAPSQAVDLKSLGG